MDILTSSVAPSWKVFRLGQLFHERKTKVSDKDYEPLSVTMKGIVTQLETAAKSDDSENRKLVLKGDFAINSRSDRKGAGGISPLDGSVSLISIVLEPSGIVPEFAHHLLRSTAFQEEFYRWGHGIVADLWTTRYADMKNIRLSLPDRPTQKAIADFLDRETARIDQLIEKKRRMVEVLGEKRQVVISRAVTKGLDPDVPMKDSGAEWLGENPVHWDITRLKRLAAMQAGTSITSDDIESEGDYPVFGGNGVRGFTSSYTHDGEFPLIGRQGALCGCVNFATGQFWASEHAVVCTPNAKVCSRWLAQLLQAMSLNRYSQSAAQPGLSVEAIGLIAAPKLSYAEQRGIVAFLDRETANIDALVAKVGATRDRLREFRSALITAAVTGQINVSTWGKQGMSDRRLDQIEETKSA